MAKPSVYLVWSALTISAIYSTAAFAELNYQFHWGRVPVADFSLFLPTPDRQIIKVEGETVGLIGKVFKYDGAIESDYSDMNSVIFSVSGEDNGFSEYRIIRFSPDQPAEILEFLDDELEQPDPVLIESMGVTVDPLRVVMELLINQGPAQCEGELSVFDGKRHYQLQLFAADEELLEADRDWTYSGNAKRCDIEVTYLESSGEEEQNPWYKDNSDQRSIWLAEVEGEIVPVRISMSGPVGKITGRLQMFKAE